MNEHDRAALAAAREHLLERVGARLEELRVELPPRVAAAIDAGGGRDAVGDLVQQAMEKVLAEVDEAVAHVRIGPGVAQ